MGNESHKSDFSAVDRRINYLQQELYTYDKFLRNPQSPGSNDMGAQAKFAIDAQGKLNISWAFQEYHDATQSTQMLTPHEALALL